MNCREAQELFGMIADLPEQHPQRRMLEWHILGCESCAAEFESWQESMEMVHLLPVEVSDEQAEAVNRKVMDRIYAESPWLAPDVRDQSLSRRLHRRIALWASCFLIIFLCSFVFLLMGDGAKKEAAEPLTGVLPTAVVAGDTHNSSDFTFALPSASRGIVEPFTVPMGPAYPQYWMLVSMAGMLLAFLFWNGIRRSRR